MATTSRPRSRRADAGKSESELALFLKFEQLAAYSRWGTAGDDEFRGVERVKRRLGEEAAVRLSAQPADQILSNQKVYGPLGALLGPGEGQRPARARQARPVARSAGVRRRGVL